jgi:hypothetical protein
MLCSNGCQAMEGEKKCRETREDTPRNYPTKKTFTPPWREGLKNLRANALQGYSTGALLALTACTGVTVFFCSVAASALALAEEQSFLVVASALAPALAAQHAFLLLLSHFFSVAGAFSVVASALCAIDMPTPKTSIAAVDRMNFFMIVSI